VNRCAPRSGIRMAHQAPIILLLFAAPLHTQRISLTDLTRLDLRNTQAEITTYHRVKALKLTEEPSKPGQVFAILRADGTNEPSRKGRKNCQLSPTGQCTH
jgi:hypothetical protein